MSPALSNTFKMLAIAAAFLPATAMAQKNLGYTVTTSGEVVMSGLKECVRSGAWTPALAAAADACKQCTPDLCPKPKAKPKPPVKKPVVKPKPKPKEKPKPAPKPKPFNLELKIELQGIAFNKAEMTEDNQKDLDQFLTKQLAPLKTPGSRIGAVIITGHTDRIGSQAYNKKLSEKRALVVRDYVVAKGIDQKLIFWEGKADKAPIPVTKFCDAKMKRKQLIECLSPNRRVTVEVVGVWMKPPPKPKPGAKPAAKPKPKTKAKAKP